MSVYKGKSIAATVSSIVFALLGIVTFIISRETIPNIIGIALIILSIIGFANYFKYSIILESKELKITTIFRAKKIKYIDIVKIYTVQAGKTKITYIVDKYNDKGKWYLRGTYPPKLADDLKSAEFNSLSELVSVNSYTYVKYKELLKELSKKVGIHCEIDPETWHVINS